MFFKHNNKNPAKQLCCPENDFNPENENANGFTRGFGVEKNVCFVDSKSAVLGLMNEENNVLGSVQQLNADIISKIKAVISSSLVSRQAVFEDHGYSSHDQQKNTTAVLIALDALTFFEMYRGLEELGYARFLSKTNLPNSIGIGLHSHRKLASVRASAHDMDSEPGHAKYVDKTLEGHLEAFGLEQVAIPGDGNCFFSAIAFHLSSLLSSPDTSNSILLHLNSIGITENMLITQISDVLRTLLVREWRGHREESYRNFLPESMDYISETINFETSGYFSSDLGDLMPIAMANVLRMPIVIVTSESHTPLISVCPEETILYSTPLFLAYNRLGAGHYDAAVSMLTRKLKIKL